jgi:hypothetical protein
LQQESRDLLELVLVPGLAVFLPWKICYALFKWIAQRGFLYREETARALIQAQALGWAGNALAWASARRLTTLVDHADQYLALTRGDGWLRRHVRTEGEGTWPPQHGASIFCTFHWGAGMWALRHAAAAGVRAHMLVAEPTTAAFQGRTILRRYIVARIGSIARILERSTLDASAAMRHALKALRADEALMAVVDVPADQVAASAPITLVGLPARVPRGLFRLAVDKQLPVTVFLSGFDLADGKRFVRLNTLGVYQDVDLLIRDVFHHLEMAIVENPPAWHFWGEAPRFFGKEANGN